MIEWLSGAQERSCGKYFNCDYGCKNGIFHNYCFLILNCNNNGLVTSIAKPTTRKPAKTTRTPIVEYISSIPSLKYVRIIKDMPEIMLRIPAHRTMNKLLSPNSSSIRSYRFIDFIFRSSRCSFDLIIAMKAPRGTMNKPTRLSEKSCQFDSLIR